MDKRGRSEKIQSPVAELGLGEYGCYFKTLEQGKTRNLIDSKSEMKAYVPVKANKEGIFVVQPDNGLIPQIEGQKKCDYLIYSSQDKQTCFFELKGANISTKEAYNPYDQIIDTVSYLNKNEFLKVLVDFRTEKHAFIVSVENQKIPKGSETKERELWMKLAGSNSMQYYLFNTGSG